MENAINKVSSAKQLGQYYYAYNIVLSVIYFIFKRERVLVG